MNRSPRRARVAGLALLTLMVLGAGLLPALATTDRTREQAAAGSRSDVVQALTVGSIAFAVIVAVAGAVLLYTVRRRRHDNSEVTSITSDSSV
jgi:ABC-type Fe3+ transport system permease subunit